MSNSLAYYLAKVPPEHVNDANFMAELAVVLQPEVDEQAFLESLPSAFDLDTAIGAQLDATGAWIGRSRQIPVPISNPWFSLDTIGLGLDQGYWEGPYGGVNLSALDDDTYRRLLYAVVQCNMSDGRSESLLAALQTYFTGINIFVADETDFPSGNQSSINLRMTIGIAGTLPGVVDLSLLAQNAIPVIPAAVQVDWGITTVSGQSVFGLDVQNSTISGLDSGAWGADPNWVAANVSQNPAIPDPSQWPLPLPTTIPSTGGLLWNNAGLVCISPGTIDPQAMPWVVALSNSPSSGIYTNGGVLCVGQGAYFPPPWVFAMPTTLPASPGIYWNDNNVVAIS